jgi:alanyl-tRNA synthetase
MALVISGYSNGIPVLAGISTFTNTHGLPLEIVLHFCKEKNYLVDWLDYVNGCLKDGHNFNTIKSRIEAACSDIYGKDYTKEIQKRLSDLHDS